MNIFLISNFVTFPSKNLTACKMLQCFCFFSKYKMETFLPLCEWNVKKKTFRKINTKKMTSIAQVAATIDGYANRKTTAKRFYKICR